MSVDRDVLLSEYKLLLKSVVFKDSAREIALNLADEIWDNKDRYDIIEKQTTAPWWFVATLHHMEAGGNFNCHLANGDPLIARTVNEPVGLPKFGKPPFSWEEAATAVLFSKGWSPENEGLDWTDTAKCLYRMESYNGWGYRLYHSDCLSPYLWSGTNHYIKGKYASDGKYDPELVSKQVGCVPIMAALGVIPELTIEDPESLTPELMQKFVRNQI